MSVIAPCFILISYELKKRLSFWGGFGSGGTAVHVPTERLVV